MPIAITEHVRPMRGGAQSHLMRAADGQYYVVKFVNNPQHRRVLANELLATRLAQLLKLPVPHGGVVEVPEALIAATPEMAVRHGGRSTPCAAGLAFGSRLPTHDPQQPIYDFLPEGALDLVANRGDFRGILLFDKWTCNCNGRQVLFCRSQPRTRLRVYMVDQGFCFNAGDWTFPDSPLRGVYHRNLVYREVTGWESFEPWLTRLETLDAQAILGCGEELPPAWYGDWSDLERLLTHLVQRRSRVRELIETVRHSQRAPFENWPVPQPLPRSAAAGERWGA